MILLFGLACLAVAAAMLCPETLVGGVLRKALVDGPGRLLTREGFTKASVGVLVLFFLLSLAAAPELLAVMAIADLTVYFEVVAMAILLGAGARMRAAITVAIRPIRWIGHSLGQMRARFSARASAGLRSPRRKPPGSEPDPDRGWAPAFG